MTTRILRLFSSWDETLDVAAGSVIFAEREPANCLFVVLDGTVGLTVRQRPLADESKGGVIGEMAMLGSRRRDVTATAHDYVRLARVNAESFRDLRSRSTEFSLLVMRTLASRLRAAGRLISAAPQPARARRAPVKPSRPMDLLELFTDTTDLERYPAGGVIIEQGTQGERMFVVVEGEVSVSLNGRELAIARPGEIVGEMALLSAAPRSATVTALTDCKLATIDRASFDVLLRTVPHFAGFVMSLMASRLRRAYTMIAIPADPGSAARSR